MESSMVRFLTRRGLCPAITRLSKETIEVSTTIAMSPIVSDQAYIDNLLQCFESYCAKSRHSSTTMPGTNQSEHQPTHQNQAAQNQTPRLDEMALLLSIIPTHEKEAFNSAVLVMLSRGMGQTVVFDLMKSFLQAEGGHPGLAVHRMTQYHNHIQRWFGRQQLGIPLSVHTLDSTDQQVLLSGCWRLLKQNDRFEKRYLLVLDESIARKWPEKSLMRVLMLISSLAERDQGLQGDGLPFVRYHIGLADEDRSLFGQAEAFLRYASPIRISSVDLLTDNLALAAELSAVHDNRSTLWQHSPRMVMHTSVGTLATRGIDASLLPIPSRAPPPANSQALLNSDFHSLVRQLQSRVPVGQAEASVPPPQSTSATPATSGNETPPGLPISLGLASDDFSLSTYQTFLRKQMEVFAATDDDVKLNGNKVIRRIVKHQVGLRCRHCASVPGRSRSPGSAYYPPTLDSFYQVGQNLAKNHILENCNHVPEAIRSRLTALRAERARAAGGKEYWKEGAVQLGLYETEQGIFMRS